MDRVHAAFGGRGSSPDRPNFSKGTCRLPVPVVGAETVDGRYIPFTDRGVARAAGGRLVAYWACSQRSSLWAEYAYEGARDWPVWAEATAVLAGCRPESVEADRIGAQAILAMRPRRRCEASWGRGKRAYWTRAEAECAGLVLSRHAGGVALRAYECPTCRDWHLTRRGAGAPRANAEILVDYYAPQPVEGRVVRMGVPGEGRGNTIAIVD